MTDVTKSVWIDAPPHIVFEYFTISEKMALWCGRSAELDPVPGGLYRVDMGEWGTVEGQFLRVETPHFVSHTVPGGEGAPDAVIEISITADAGGSRVVVKQSGLDELFHPIAARGWDNHLARLSVVATGGTAPPDPMCDRNMASFN